MDMMDTPLQEASLKTDTPVQYLSPEEAKKRVGINAVAGIGKDLQYLQGEIRGRFRKSVTGDSSMSVRRHTNERVRHKLRKAQEELRKPKTLRMIDRIAFSAGVGGIVLTEYLMLEHPKHFWAYYCVVIPTLVFIRYFLYTKMKMQYFLLDFCYFAQALQMIDTFYPSDLLFGMNFMFANGPLALAVIAWRNSLVFHSLDKITSVFIHVFPLCLTYCNRWHADRGAEYLDAHTFLVAMGTYLVWQLGYLLETEVRVKQKFENDKRLSNSLRWLADKGHNIPSVQIVRKLLVVVGFMGKDEPFVSTSIKTKFVMVVSQLLFTVFSMVPCFFIFRNQNLHALWAIFVMGYSVWNGATYYFEVFVSSYQNSRIRDIAAAQSVAGVACAEGYIVDADGEHVALAPEGLCPISPSGPSFGDGSMASLSDGEFRALDGAGQGGRYEENCSESGEHTQEPDDEKTAEEDLKLPQAPGDGRARAVTDDGLTPSDASDRHDEDASFCNDELDHTKPIEKHVKIAEPSS
ncbi:putative membrane protein [Diplonema papillatum]|nr:putative membrane protein [Diplonema papillatum]